jgi:hypothetical protein
VSWGYHMWKHTKDPSYIQSPDAAGETSKKVKIVDPTSSSASVSTKSVTAQQKVIVKPPAKAKVVTSSQPSNSVTSHQKTLPRSSASHLQPPVTPKTGASQLNLAASQKSTPATPQPLSNHQPLVLQPQQQQPVQPYKGGPNLQAQAAKDSFSSSKMLTEILNFPRAPEAHATSYTQISQPLCLQTSRLVVEEPLKPLNMQVILNPNQP